MVKRIIQGTIISSLVVVLPSLRNLDFLMHTVPWTLIFIGLLASVFQPAYNPFTIFGKSGDHGTGAQIIWSVYLTQVFSILEAAYLRFPKSVEWDLVSVAALAAALIGLAIRTWAVLSLGNLFTMNIEIRENHSIYCEGPYRFVRHPSYLGAFILYLSTILIVHAWYSFLFAAPFLSFAFLRRIHFEERLLSSKFEGEYDAYRKKVKKLIPGIW